MKPGRGEVWLADLDPTRGREQAGRRPCLVVSADPLNRGPAQLVVVLPITSRDKGIPFHVGLEPPEGGVTVRSFIKCEDVRSISTQRLTEKWGAVRNETLLAVEDRLRILLSL
ncbi:type II toxin-antitoxin system PemK/MazF family toxin [Gloeobacter violaceus]|uniref:type II toxin-antitoxin system PemK/MazF family toxin n=1 Tax=Gloeobacter violaceus TaxID=33072 RepID=UPI000312B2AD|nr:type II toxin-antitoxin system PemK/MazF family toxin [Gloeobacter violaceus]